MDKIIFGANVQKYRERLGMSRETLANLMTESGQRTSLKRLTNMEKGQCTIYAKDFCALPDLLQISVDELTEMRWTDLSAFIFCIFRA